MFIDTARNLFKGDTKRLATSRIEICLHSSISMQYHHFVVVFGSDGTDEDSSKVLGVALSKSSSPDFQTCT